MLALWLLSKYDFWKRLWILELLLTFTSGHTAAAAYLIGATVAEKFIEEYNL